MYNLNGEPVNENTYSSPSGGINGGYTYNAAPISPNPATQMNPYGPKKSGVCGILGLIFSILAFPLGWFIPILGILLAIAGIVLSIIGCNKTRACNGTGIAGLIISILALIGLIILIVVRTITYMNEINALSAPLTIDQLEDLEDDINDSDTNSNKAPDRADNDFVVSHSWDEAYSEIDDIDDIILYESEYARITATELVYETIGDTLYPYINITIENLGNEDFAIDTSYSAVNGVVITGYILEDVYAGQTLETDLSFDSDEYKEAGFSTINSLSCILNLYDPDSYDTIHRDEVPREFIFDDSSENFSISDLTSEAPIFSEAGCDIYYLGTVDKYEDGIPDFCFYIDNHSSQMVCVTFDELYINNTSQPGALDISDIGSGCGVFFTLSSDDAILADSITEASMTVEIIDGDYNNLFDDSVSFLP